MKTLTLKARALSLQQLTGLVCLLLFAAEAAAHAETGVAGGLLSGLLHPVYGIDHLLAMVAVGLWGAQLGAPAIWVLPIAFPTIMAVGALLGMANVPIPIVEVGIALSALTLGTMVLLNFRASLWVAALLISAFGLWHGYAHGTELPAAVNPLAYGVGFVVATGLLHLSGILLGTLTRWPAGARAVRCCGAAIAAFGAYFLAATLGLNI